jgi:hypothetical protein
MINHHFIFCVTCINFYKIIKHIYLYLSSSVPILFSTKQWAAEQYKYQKNQYLWPTEKRNKELFLILFIKISNLLNFNVIPNNFFISLIKTGIISYGIIDIVKIWKMNLY